jgi:ornithine decarboxylase
MSHLLFLGDTHMAATARILDFLRDRRPEGPCLVVDLEVIAYNYKAFTRAMPDTRIFYAVKANPAPEALTSGRFGSCFDTAALLKLRWPCCRRNA